MSLFVEFAPQESVSLFLGFANKERELLLWSRPLWGGLRSERAQPGRGSPTSVPRGRAQSVPRGLRLKGRGLEAGDVGVAPTRDPRTRGPVPPTAPDSGLPALTAQRPHGASQSSGEDCRWGEGPSPSPALRAVGFKATSPLRRPEAHEAIRGGSHPLAGGRGKARKTKGSEALNSKRCFRKPRPGV